MKKLLTLMALTCVIAVLISCGATPKRQQTVVPEKSKFQEIELTIPNLVKNNILFRSDTRLRGLNPYLNILY